MGEDCFLLEFSSYFSFHVERLFLHVNHIDEDKETDGTSESGSEEEESSSEEESGEEGEYESKENEYDHDDSEEAITSDEEEGA